MAAGVPKLSDFEFHNFHCDKLEILEGKQRKGQSKMRTNYRLTQGSKQHGSRNSQQFHRTKENVAM